MSSQNMFVIGHSFELLWGPWGTCPRLFILLAPSTLPQGPLRDQQTPAGSVSSLARQDSRSSWLSSTVATSPTRLFKLKLTKINDPVIRKDCSTDTHCNTDAP